MRPLPLLLSIALPLLVCRFVPGAAAAVTAGFSAPAMAFLHRLTAPIPFPLAEPLALTLAAGLLAALPASLPRGKGPRLAAGTALVLALLALLWGPPLCLPGEAIPAPEAEQLTWLCGELIDALNASPLAFPEPAEALRLAPAVAGGPALAVKAARYPEWMDACRAWGLFVPLTGEALVNAEAPAPLIPFTAVHELMHLSGLAGEGAANVAAWERCLDAGGPFADSARLWALRYALGLLGDADPAARRQAAAKMEGPLARTFQQCGGDADPDRLGDYAALAAHLATR